MVNKSEYPKQRSLRLLVRLGLGFAAVCVIGALLYVFLKPRSLADHAEEIVEALLVCDGDTLMQYSFEEEIERNSLSGAKFSDLCNRLIKPRLQRFQRAGPTVKMALSNHGVAEVPLMDSRGRKMNLGITVLATDDGPRAVILATLIAAWMGENMVSKDIPFTVANKLQSCIEGLAQDRPFLRSAGITHLFNIDFEKGVLVPSSWEETEAGWKRIVNRSKEP